MKDFLKNVDIFSNLSEQDIENIASMTTRKSYKKNNLLFHEEDMSDGVYIIKSGFAKVYSLSESGKEQTLAILSEGDIIGEISLYDNAWRSATVQTIEPTEFIFIPLSKFKELLNSLPSLNLKIAELVAERLRITNVQVTKMVDMSSYDRVLTKLEEMAEKFGKSHSKGIIIQPRLTHNDIASLTGLVRETVTKTLNDLVDEGTIDFENRRIVMLHRG